jgi:hypothetical protein
MLCSGVRISEQVSHDFASLIYSDIHRDTNRLLQSNIADITLHESQELPVVRSTELLCVCLCRVRLCGLVVRVLGYRFGGSGSIPGTTRFSGGGGGNK